MDAPLTPGWYLIVRKGEGDQTAQVRARWDGAHFLTFETPEEELEPSEVASWKPILGE